MVTEGSVVPAPGDAVTVQVTVWPDTPQLQNDPAEPGVPNVRFLSSVSATTKLPESALDPELLTVSVITPLEPEATAPPTAPAVRRVGGGKRHRGGGRNHNEVAGCGRRCGA